jgi:hypothetical protein
MVCLGAGNFRTTIFREFHLSIILSYSMEQRYCLVKDTASPIPPAHYSGIKRVTPLEG